MNGVVDAAQPRSAIELSGVSKLYGATPILRGLDLRFEAGAFTVVLGPSGCGKSTLLRLIAGLEATSGGAIAIGGKVVDRLAPKDRGCAMVFQNYALYPHMSVAQNIGYGLKLSGMPAVERRRRVADVAALIGLGDLLERKPGQLSGGQRQRVAIGRAIARRPRVLLFDEPLSNLDAKLRHEMRVELRKLHDEIGATSIFVTHDQAEAMSLADRLVVMNRGEVEQQGAPTDIYRKPASLFVAGFIGTPPMNLLPATLMGGRLALGDGQSIPSPATSPEVKRVTLGFRPEDMTTEPDEAGQQAALAIDVTAIEDLGSHVVAHGRLGGHKLMASLRSSGCLSPGSSQVFHVPVERLSVFDADAGLRMMASPL